MKEDEIKLSVADWLSFLETRSDNYITAILGPNLRLLILQALASWMMRGGIVDEISFGFGYTLDRV